MDEPTRIELLKSYLKSDPDDAFTKYALALEFIKCGDDTEAEKLMENIFNVHTDYLPNYYHYGKLLERKGAIKGAIVIYQAGINRAKTERNSHTLSELQNACDDLL